MYIDAKTQAYAEGYHDGRMNYDMFYYDDMILDTMYKQGYSCGVEDRSEQDERN